MGPEAHEKPFEEDGMSAEYSPDHQLDIDWQRRRTALNHDWLKNRLLVGLAEWINVLDDLVEDDSHTRAFLITILPEWLVQREQFRSLFAQCEASVSPALLLRRPPLCAMSEADGGWLGPLVHELWVTRSDVRRLTAEAQRCLSDADECYERLSGEIAKMPSAALGLMRNLRTDFGDFHSQCIRLGGAVERLRSVDSLAL